MLVTGFELTPLDFLCFHCELILLLEVVNVLITHMHLSVGAIEIRKMAIRGLLLHLIIEHSLQKHLLPHQRVLNVIKPIGKVDHLILDQIYHLLLLILPLQP